MSKKIVSFWARKPVKTKVSFRARGKRISFTARVPSRTKVRFKA